LIDLPIGYHDELAPERRNRPVANREQLAELACLHGVGCFNGVQYAIALTGHLGVTVDDVSQPFTRETDRHTANRRDPSHRYRRAILVDQLGMITSYGRRPFDVTSWSRSRPGRVIVRVVVSLIMTIKVYRNTTEVH
jgi:hypothetical protein